MTTTAKIHTTNSKTAKTWCGRDTEIVDSTKYGAPGKDGCVSCHRNENTHYDKLAALLKAEEVNKAEYNRLSGEAETEVDAEVNRKATTITFKRAKDDENRPITRVWADGVRVATIRRDKFGNIRVLYNDRTHLAFTVSKVAHAKERIEQEFAKSVEAEAKVDAARDPAPAAKTEPLRPYLCWHCDNRFSTRRGMNQHFHLAHGLGADGITTVEEMKKRHTTVTAPKMLGYAHDDGGRADAGFKGSAGDCVVRAVAIAGALTYREVYDAMSATMKVNGYTATGNAYSIKPNGGKRQRGQMNAKAVQMSVVIQMGFRKIPFEKGPRPTFTEAHREYGNCVVNTSRHTCALVDGALRDTFDGRMSTIRKPICLSCDSSEGTMVGSGDDKCSKCGEVRIVELIEITNERKAMSIFVPV